jgi:hypothetical protein
MNVDIIEKRDHDLRGNLAVPTMAERDRRALIATVRRLEEAMREALSYLKNGEDEPSGEVLAAIEALAYALEQG